MKLDNFFEGIDVKNLKLKRKTTSIPIFASIEC
jgi:hypothetical protein